MNKITLHQGDSRAVLARYPDHHFDSCVTDPPYELGFMGKKWDASGISYSVEMWREVFRVLKPGAHLLAFGGARTYHRMAGTIEEAGFIIRDQIMWLYGSGFPKSLDVSKAIDKAAGAEREVVGKRTDRAAKPKIDIRGGKLIGEGRPQIDLSNITAPATPLARQWHGWGTALKPAHEPIVVARKPLEGTVVENVLKWGCGGIKIAACLIPCEPGDIGARIDGPKRAKRGSDIWCNDDGSFDLPRNYHEPNGRWPANVIHDGSEEVLAEFAKYGDRKTSNSCVKRSSGKDKNGYRGTSLGQESRPAGTVMKCYSDTGSAARFFYCAKATPAERNLGCEGMEKKPRVGHICQSEGRKMAGTTNRMPNCNHHPTVKPITLMAYLVRLVTPPGGLVLDPFMGSGSTLIAAAKEGFDSVGIDLELENLDLAECRARGHLGFLVEIVHAP